MLQADLIAELLQRESDEPAVFEFPVAGETGGIKDDVIVDVCAVRMGCDNECVLSMCEAHRRFVSDPVCLLLGNLAGLKRLPDLVCYDIARNLPPGNAEILFLGEQKLLIDGFRIAGVGGDILAVLGFLPDLGIVGPILQALPDGFSLFTCIAISRVAAIRHRPLSGINRDARASPESATSFSITHAFLAAGLPDPSGRCCRLHLPVWQADSGYYHRCGEAGPSLLRP